MKPARTGPPLSAVILGILGAVALVVGILAMATKLTRVHPLLNADGGLALAVSGVALLLSGAFPLVLARLAASTSDADETR